MTVAPFLWQLRSIAGRKPVDSRRAAHHYSLAQRIWHPCLNIQCCLDFKPLVRSSGSCPPPASRARAWRATQNDEKSSSVSHAHPLDTTITDIFLLFLFALSVAYKPGFLWRSIHWLLIPPMPASRFHHALPCKRHRQRLCIFMHQSCRNAIF